MGIIKQKQVELTLFSYVKQNISPDIDGFDIRNYSCPIAYGLPKFKEDCDYNFSDCQRKCNYDPNECWNRKMR